MLLITFNDDVFFPFTTYICCGIASHVCLNVKVFMFTWCFLLVLTLEKDDIEYNCSLSSHKHRVLHYHKFCAFISLYYTSET